MARRAKVVINADGEDRRETGYYSTPSFVADFLARKVLDYRPDVRTVLDPCVGKGELATPFLRAGISVTGIDIVDRGAAGCTRLVVGDFLELAAPASEGSLFDNRPDLWQADIIVANPPYNCHETDYIRANKQRLVATFGKSTALNMYSLFVRAIIDVARPGALIALVVHDSFLTAVGHKDLRRHLFASCTLLNLHLCPTALFADQGAEVRTCLMILEKGHRPGLSVEVSNRPASVADFRDTLRSEGFERRRLSEITLAGEPDNNEIVIGLPTALSALFDGRRLGQIAPCVTGVSTGNDTKYLSATRRPGFTIPFYKNPASRRFYADPDGYIIDDFDREARTVPNFMVRNRDLLMKGGLSCSSMGVAFGAAVRPPNTLCGVNPNVIVGEDDKWWLLAYLNSRLCLYLLRGALIRSNMVTAGYASRIPTPLFDERIRTQIGDLAREACQNASIGEDTTQQKARIDFLLEDSLGLERDVVELLRAFAADPIRLT